jgi:hypothetical protein
MKPGAGRMDGSASLVHGFLFIDLYDISMGIYPALHTVLVLARARVQARVAYSPRIRVQSALRPAAQASSNRSGMSTGASRLQP